MQSWSGGFLTSQFVTVKRKWKKVPAILLTGLNRNGVKVILDGFMEQGASFMDTESMLNARVRGNHQVLLGRDRVSVILVSKPDEERTLTFSGPVDEQWLEDCADTGRVCVLVSYGDHHAVVEDFTKNDADLLGLRMRVRFA